ncbi:DNA-binding transcriptional LysR family regulator [Haloactinopolyspora alba]|uniref:DNA-binding transcriptional LysR family regulator n=1 Tax=Haloactinopolyspora alba TaxID=648780 RepID=A0A2P8DWI1_9ACTN|nr:LysR family transcriptional regulator [Haloactinopolyspora alba]PSL01585.1 DNA-binding transcriptional LysR family regulator [Haloactinopolyspora alba]
MLDVSRLRLLRAVIATGSIRAGAEALSYTPSAVSQQLTALQRETGLRLFERAGRGIEPTAAGRILATEAEPLFEELSRVEGVVGDLRAGRVGSLSIGYFGSAGAAWLPTIASTLRAEFPELRLDLQLTEFDGPGPHDVDLDIFVEARRAEPPTAVDVRWLIDDPFVAVVRDDDPLAGHADVALADLAGRRWVDNDLADGACRRVLLEACAEAGFSPQFAVQTHDYRTAISFVTTGIGITVVPVLGVGDLPAGLTTVSIVSPTPVRRINVAVKKSVAEHPAARRTLDLLEAAVRGGRSAVARL